MSIYPAPVFQLESGAYASVNCGPTCAVMALDFATYGAVQTTPNAIRRRGDMGTGPTDYNDLKRGIAAYAPEAAAAGYEAPNLFRLGYIWREQLLSSLARKDALHILALRYASVPDPYRNDDYQGGHFVCALRLYLKRTDGTFRRVRPYRLSLMSDAAKTRLWTRVYDPLADGRWSADLKRRVAVAPQMWPLSVLWKAGDSFYDVGTPDGRAPAAVIYRCGRL